MASKSLGTLTVDLQAKIGAFVSGLSEAERAALKASKTMQAEIRAAEKAQEQAMRKMADEAKALAKAQQDEMKKAAKAAEDYAKAVKKAEQEAQAAYKANLAVVGRGAAMVGTALLAGVAAFAKNTMDAQREQAQLAAVIKSTGDVSGYTIDQLNAMADAMSRASTFSGGEITEAQTTLLAFTNIAGEQLPRALQATMDMAARTGMSLKQSAETIGRAIDVPTQGFAALSRQGFKFGEDVKEMLEELEATGQTVAAQDYLLRALEESYGGAAEAARDTLGGALAALKNQVNDMMTGEPGSVNGLTNLVNELTESLQSSETQRAFGVFKELLKGLGDAAMNAFNTVKFAVANIINMTLTATNLVANQVKTNANILSSVIRADAGGVVKAVKDGWNGYSREVDIFRAGQREAWREITGDTIRDVGESSKATQQAVEVQVDQAKLLRHRFDQIVGESVKGTKQDPEYARQIETINQALKEGVINAEEFAKAQKALDERFTKGERKGRGGGGRRGKSEAEKEAERAAREAERLKERLDNLFEGAITGYQQTLFLLGKEGEEIRAIWETESGRYKDLDEARKKEIVDQARIVDQKVKEYEVEKKFKDLQKDNAQYLEDLQFEATLIGKSREEQELLNLARQLELELQAQSLGMSEQQLAAIRAQNEAIVEQAKNNIRLEESMHQQIQAMDQVRSSFSSAFSEWIGGTKSFKDAFLGALDSINQRILQMISDNLMEKLFGQMGTSETGSAGGWFGSIFGSLFGGTGKANGGHVSGGEFTRVNERGPELLTTSGGKQYLLMGDNSGTITPNHMRSAGTGLQQINNFNITGRVDRRTQLQLAQEAGRRANAAASRS